MYLTQLPIIAKDDYALHQHIRQMIPGDQKVLFQRNNEGVTIFSERKPDGVDSKEIDTSLYTVGGKYTFTLRLNPAKKDIRTKKRVALDPEQVKSWIREKLSSIGATVDFQYIREETRRSVRKEKVVSLASVLCFGFLSITDADLFRKALVNGIGHGKGLGFGFINLFS
jgi:CRISPR-associated protein Cas6/Cse3/CasE subtype I-E